MVPLFSFQWSNATNAGFTNSIKPWLPISEDFKIYNVETQNDTYLELFRNISKLRKEPAFERGEVYFPFHDIDIFSFLR